MNSRVFVTLMRFLLQTMNSRNILWNTIFYFLSSFLILDIRFQNSKMLFIFLLLKPYNTFLIMQFYSFCCLSIPTFHYQYGIFLNVKFPSNIKALYSYHFYLGIIILLLVSFYTSHTWRSFVGVWVTQIFSGFLDSSEYCSRSQQCWSLDCLYSSSDINFFNTLSKP